MIDGEVVREEMMCVDVCARLFFTWDERGEGGSRQETKTQMGLGLGLDCGRFDQSLGGV